MADTGVGTQERLTGHGARVSASSVGHSELSVCGHEPRIPTTLTRGNLAAPVQPVSGVLGADSFQPDGWTDGRQHSDRRK